MVCAHQRAKTIAGGSKHLLTNSRRVHLASLPAFSLVPGPSGGHHRLCHCPSRHWARTCWASATAAASARRAPLPLASWRRRLARPLAERLDGALSSSCSRSVLPLRESAVKPNPDRSFLTKREIAQSRLQTKRCFSLLSFSAPLCERTNERPLASSSNAAWLHSYLPLHLLPFCLCSLYLFPVPATELRTRACAQPQTQASLSAGRQRQENGSQGTKCTRRQTNYQVERKRELLAATDKRSTNK